MRKSATWPSVLLAGLTLAAGCDDVDFGPGTGDDPRGFTGAYAWVFEEFVDGDPRGYPSVQLYWEVPSGFRDEVFRVYGRRASSGGYRLLATVTSCSDGACVYHDINVEHGRSYDYYIATVDDRGQVELGTSQAIRIDVPQFPDLSPPGSPRAVALDGAAFVRWSATGALRYSVLVREDGGPLTFIGESDGTGYLDTRAENGSRYIYFLAAVDEFGHVSPLSQTLETHPRPDYYSEIVFADADQPAASGFRFVSSETLDPIVPGTSPEAQWRLDVAGGAFRIQPLGPTAVTEGTFTTQLTCGPGSDADCVDVRTAPAAAQFGFGPVVVRTGDTYVFRLVGTDNRTRYAKIRVQGTAVDGQGRRLMVFDWAYQLRPDEPSLDVIGG